MNDIGGTIFIVIVALFWLIGLVIGLIRIVEIGEVDRYKKGQIDALNGIVKYKLITNKDKTSQWKLIEEVDK